MSDGLENVSYACMELVPCELAASEFIDLVETIVIADIEADHVVELESDTATYLDVQFLVVVIIHVTGHAADRTLILEAIMYGRTCIRPDDEAVTDLETNVEHYRDSDTHLLVINRVLALGCIVEIDSRSDAHRTCKTYIVIQASIEAGKVVLIKTLVHWHKETCTD